MLSSLKQFCDKYEEIYNEHKEESDELCAQFLKWIKNDVNALRIMRYQYVDFDLKLVHFNNFLVKIYFGKAYCNVCSLINRQPVVKDVQNYINYYS